MKRFPILEKQVQAERITAEEQTVYSQMFDYTNRMIYLLCPMELHPKRSGRRIGKKHALKEYDQFTLNTSCFWESTRSIIAPVVQFHEIFVTKIMIE